MLERCCRTNTIATEGNTVLVEGSIRPRSYENNEGQRIYVTKLKHVMQALASQPAATPNQTMTFLL